MMTGLGLGDRMRACVALATLTVLTAVSVLASGCTSSRPVPPPVSLPAPRTGEVTFYLSLPASAARLDQAAAKAAMPGSSSYRHFTSLATAATRFGATDAQIRAIAKSVQSLGLQFAADPTRLFARVTGSPRQWRAALRTP
jgi:Pro-kumamolisin, activation domain